MSTTQPKPIAYVLGYVVATRSKTSFLYIRSLHDKYQSGGSE